MFLNLTKHIKNNFNICATYIEFKPNTNFEFNT